MLIIMVTLVGCDIAENSSPKTSADPRPKSFDYSAHWIEPATLLIQKHPAAQQFFLYHSPDASIALHEGKLSIGENPGIRLRETATSANLAVKYRHLVKTHVPLKPESIVVENTLKLMLREQLVLVQQNSEGDVLQASKVQKAKLIDHLYTRREKDADEVDYLGAHVFDDNVHFRIWAPTAHEVEVLVFDQQKQALSPASIPMVFDTDTGVWHAIADKTRNRAFYQYRLRVYHPATDNIEQLITTDPYSLSLSTNSVYSQVVDLNDDDLKPTGWDKHQIPSVNNYEDSILYEMHLRDFSATDASVPIEAKGKYQAFALENSLGLVHLKSLRDAGLTHLHLLPMFDIATVNEDRAQVIQPWDTLESICSRRSELEICQSALDLSKPLHQHLQSYSPKSADAQALIEKLRTLDPYNWGYDPLHYSVPEGSYAKDPDGVARIYEFRTMVQAIHEMGFRLVMDVVYNHTFAAGLHKQSVLDKVVPHYYHRLDPITGEIAQSTCCDNTATENVMMGKLMLDSLEVWARDYKIDGFRFDLMGHQPKDLMLEAYRRVRMIDEDNYFYGEGWNFGEVANNAIFIQATQNEMAGSEIGTFNDRLRDAIRGGRPFDKQKEIRRGQGLVNGLLHLPNELQPDDVRDTYSRSMDQAKVGLTGNLANYPLKNMAGEAVTGKDIPYGGGPTGYALDPADTINYVSKHDNQTLWDNNQYRIPFETGAETRVRMQSLALAYPVLAQGIPFIHMGSELLRSKSFLRDSYDFGDWFNAVDFSMQQNNYNVGLPPASKDQSNWPLILEILEHNESRDLVTPELIRQSSQTFTEWLKIRSSSPLFRLTTAQDIIARLSFPDIGKLGKKGIIAMKISDEGFDTELDKLHKSIMVIFNNGTQAQSVPYPGAEEYRLHPVQAEGTDARVRALARTENATFKVPGLSAVVFIK